jgi:acetoin utilization protein AcuB
MFNIPVEEYTTYNPITGTEEMSPDMLRNLMNTHGIRHLPIVRDAKVVGVISDRNLRFAQTLSEAHKIQITAADIMATDPVMVTSGAMLDEVAFVMSEKKIGSVIIIDEETSNFIGIFTLTDALNALIEITRAVRHSG